MILQDFNPKFHWLTGTKEQISEVTRAFRVYFSKVHRYPIPWSTTLFLHIISSHFFFVISLFLCRQVDENDDNEEDYLVDHSIVMYLISPEGDFLEFYTQRANVSDIISSIEGHIKESKSKK